MVNTACAVAIVLGSFLAMSIGLATAATANIGRQPSPRLNKSVAVNGIVA